MFRRTGPGKIDEMEATCPVTKALLYNFDFDGDGVKPQHKYWLDECVTPLMQTSQYNLWMRGTASKVGKDDYNLDLSRRRVESVHDYLVSRGVNSNQIQTEWQGERLSTSTKMDDERDRAVELHVQAEVKPLPDRPKPPPQPPPPPPTSSSFRLRVLGSAQVGKVINLGKALSRIKKLAKLRKLPKVGVAFDMIFLEIQDRKNHISAFYAYVAPGFGAGLYWVSASHKGPWNRFATSKPILASQFDGAARFTTLGVGPWSKNYINLIGTPKGVKQVYMEIDTGFTWGAGGSFTAGYCLFLDSATNSP